MDVADNMDLIRIVQEFEESYEMKYNKKPKLVSRHGSESSSEVRVLVIQVQNPKSKRKSLIIDACEAA